MVYAVAIVDAAAVPVENVYAVADVAADATDNSIATRSEAQMIFGSSKLS